MRRGFWIVLEGPDGVGKSTVAKHLAQLLKEKGIETCITSEPGLNPIGALIRDWVLKEHVEPPEVYALLFVADRYYHIHREVLPALYEGKTVIQERYMLSTIAYQSIQGLPEEWLIIIQQRLPHPDITIVLLLEPEQLAERIAQRNQQRDIFENMDFLRKLVQKYTELAHRYNLPIFYNYNSKETAIKIYELIEKHIDITRR